MVVNESVMKKKLLIFIFFLMGMLFSGRLMAQDIVRSNNITKIGGKEYYLHNVKPGETLWGISKVYNVSIEEIEKLNPEVKKDGLKAGHVLGIPVRPMPEPVAVEPVPEPKPELQPEPKPEPKPEPVPEPQPQPQVEEPVAEPVPEPEPIKVEPEPEPIVEHPVPAVPQPVVVEPEPEPEPEPVSVEPEPVVEVPVEPQTNHKAFYDGTHRIMQPNEDIYDIAKEYGIDVRELRAANRGLNDEPAAGTRLTIPQIANENDYIIHNCERNERVSSLLKRWKVNENEFRRMNVSVGSHVFENQIVLIPINPIHDFYWMSGTQPPVAEENEVEEPVQEEVIPVEVEEPQPFVYEGFEAEPDCVAAPENARRRYKVALMIPLYLNDVSSLDMSKENLPKLQKARSLSFLQFYEGFMMAVDAMEDQGLKLDLTVMDVTDNVNTAHTALSQIRGEDFDLIVGPFFGKSFAVIEEYAKANNIVVVNPLSTRASVVADSPNVVKVKPGDIGQILAISSLVKNYYSDANVFILSREKSADSAFLMQLEHHLNLTVNDEVTVSGDDFLRFARDESQRLEMGSRMVSTVDVEGQVYSVNDFKSGTTERVVLANPVHRYKYDSENLGKLKSQLSGVRNNLIVAYGDDNVFATQILNSLAKETERYPITLVAAPNWTKFEKLLVENLLQMNAIYLDDGFVDYNSDAAKHFVSRFRRKYAAEPQSYAFEGYDMATFFLTALMRYGDSMLDCLNCCNVPLLNTQYRFFNRNMESAQGKGRENQYWNMYQYDNELIELKPIDPFKKTLE